MQKLAKGWATQRTAGQLLRLAAAFMLPLIVLAGFQLYQMVQSGRARLEADAHARAQEVMLRVDAQVLSEVRLVKAFASNPALKDDDLQGSIQRGQEYLAIAETWKAIRLLDGQTGRELAHSGRRRGAPPSRPDDGLKESRATLGGASVGGVVLDPNGGFRVPITTRMQSRSGRLYDVVIDLDPRAIHQTANPRYRKSLVAAVVDVKGRFISRSRSYETRVGTPGSVYVRKAVAKGGAGIYQGVTLEGETNYTAYVTSTLTGWSTHVAVSAAPFESARQSSSLIWAAVIAGCLVASLLTFWLTMRDVAQQRVEQTRMLNAQKMEALGQLTGGIAHDFNNLLTVIIGGLDLAIRKLEPDSPARRPVEGALEAGRRAASLTSKLLAFSRLQEFELEPLDLKGVLGGLSDLLEQSLGPGVHVTLATAEDARWVRSDKVQLELAILNLAVNARDAMEGQGDVQILTRRLGDQAEIEVRDNGSGMSPEVAARALEPFFTTKAPERGTGLGLAQAYTLARQSGGDLRLESAPGQGTSVFLTLPLVDARHLPPRADGDRTFGAQLGAGKFIVVVDDDPSVRGVIVDQLESAGFRVMAFDDGESMLQVLEGLSPELIILDYLMPGLNGAEVASRALKIKPGQRIVLVSGHADREEIARVSADLMVLRKPFDRSALLTAVNAALGPATDD